jgi:IS5 family transposase
MTLQRPDWWDEKIPVDRQRMDEMTKQASFSELEYSAKKKPLRDRFLAEIDAVTPLAGLERTVLPFYPSSGGCGRPPSECCTCTSRSEVLAYRRKASRRHSCQAIRRFVGIDLARKTDLDAKTLLKFRRLAEAHQLTESIFNAINAHLAEQGLLLREGTIVDAALIAAPPSTKNKDARAPRKYTRARKAISGTSA